MTARLEPECGQATLDGMPDVQAPAPAVPAEAFRFVVVGLALAPAYVHTTRHNDVQLVVLLQQQVEHHPQAAPLLATYTWPDAGSFAATHAAASAKAVRIGAGTCVVVRGHGMEPGHHQGKPVLRLLLCDGVELASHWDGAAGAERRDDDNHND